ncbi:uncharacterized protein LOC62_06G008470 [Vanrija pseudolonga]|uniref:Uncharacterized protein n=1 Tax=Vanrija pseudolonga TaxID=143232 RepID=A0AAF0YDX0_9TREE|nr:hypothetical protein LOC62_06G008470 [Vanrija pseudolonga]
MDIWRMSNNVTYVWKAADKVHALEAIRDNPTYRQHFFPSAASGTRLKHKWKSERDLCLDILRNEVMWMAAAKRAKLVTKEKDTPDGPVWKATPKWTSAVSNPVRNLVSTRQMTPDDSGKNYFEKAGAKRSWKSKRDVPKSMKAFLDLYPFYFILLDLMRGEARPVLPPPRAPTVEPPSRRRVNPRLQNMTRRDGARGHESSPELVESDSDSGSFSSPPPSRPSTRLPPSNESESSSSEEEDELHSDSTAPKREPSSSPALTSTPTMDHPSKEAFTKSLSYVDDQLRRSSLGPKSYGRSPSTSSASESSAAEDPAPPRRLWPEGPKPLDVKPGIDIFSPSRPARVDKLPPTVVPVPSRKRARSPSTSSASTSSSSSDEPAPPPRPRWSAPLDFSREPPPSSPAVKQETVSIYTISSSSSDSSDDIDDTSQPVRITKAPQGSSNRRVSVDMDMYSSDHARSTRKARPRSFSPTSSFIDFDPPSEPEPEPVHQRFDESSEVQPKPKRPRTRKKAKQTVTIPNDAANPISLKWFSPTITLKNYWPVVTWLMEAEPTLKKPLLAARRAKMAGSRRLNELLKAYEDLLDPRGTKHRVWAEGVLRRACTSKFMQGSQVYSPIEGQLTRRLLLLGESAGMTRLSEKQFQSQLGKDNRLILLKAAPEHDPLLKHKVLDARGNVKYWEMSPLSFMLVIETNFLCLVNKLRAEGV